jgi:FMN phosphatase YigB (HAD superfamily)
MPIRAITFDWGDTLAANHGMPYVATQRRAFNALARDLREMGFTVDEGWVDRALADIEAAWRTTISFEANPEHREVDMNAMFSGWLSRVVGLDADSSTLSLALERCQATLTDTVIPYSEAAPALSLLKARGYRLGVLSHVPWPGSACRAWFERHGLAPYLDFYSLSCEVGWIKPNPRHYQNALDQAGCRPDEVLHVGDHPERDIVGARAFGFRTCLRHTENIYPHDALHACKPDAEILHLRELVDVAKRLSP